MTNAVVVYVMVASFTALQLLSGYRKLFCPSVKSANSQFTVSGFLSGEGAEGRIHPPGFGLPFLRISVLYVSAIYR